MKKTITLLFLLLICGCKPKNDLEKDHLALSKNILNYYVTPKDSLDKSGLMFSDQGAWFAYSFPKTKKNFIGFSGPFLMTQQNGIWSSPILSNLSLSTGHHKGKLISFKKDLISQHSYSSHLEQIFKNEKIELKQELVFISGHTALQKTTITNISDYVLPINANIQGGVSNIGIKISTHNNIVKLKSENSPAIGYIQTSNKINRVDILDKEKFYAISLEGFDLQPKQSQEIIISQSFIFPEYSWEKEQNFIKFANFDSLLHFRKQEKSKQLKSLVSNRASFFKDNIYAKVLVKAHLTLQNNWRIPAGEIEHEGLFPSYHYKWFNGFWSWDSWKHAVGLSYYNLPLAKEQVKLMFKFQNEDGFVADCVFRDTLIEAHNYRDTKPPLSAWAVTKIHNKSNDISFLKEIYPKLKKYHYWWYNKRDHDTDGICEYGSTDGSLIAAKWESGMDNAIRFDHSKILKNSENAYSINQESVDLNAYLYA